MMAGTGGEKLDMVYESLEAIRQHLVIIEKWLEAPMAPSKESWVVYSVVNEMEPVLNGVVTDGLPVVEDPATAADLLRKGVNFRLVMSVRDIELFYRTWKVKRRI